MDDTDQPTSDRAPDFKDRLKQFAQPLVDSLDSRLRKQVEERVDERVEAILTNRLAVIERAIADIDRTLKQIQERLASDADPEEATSDDRGRDE